ncbi:MAG: hypothetical protein HYX78_12965 [Armatimonadetes bacterium]|nr:hypothetical protein [Armatimonadota bacterium]
MPEINHEQLNPAIAEAARGFCAEERPEEGDCILLGGPHLQYVYEEPLTGVEQGALFSFDAGDRPRAAMVIEKLGERLEVRIARLTSEKIVVYHQDQLFTDLENNYMEQML